MNWQCRLYGHQWRHPGEYEVVVLDERVPAYPFRCAACESETLFDATGNELPPDALVSSDPGPELDDETEPELEPVERDEYQTD